MSFSSPHIRRGDELNLAWLVDVDSDALNRGYPGGRLRQALRYTPIPDGHPARVTDVRVRHDDELRQSWQVVTVKLDVYLGSRRTGWRRLRRKKLVATAVVPVPWVRREHR